MTKSLWTKLREKLFLDLAPAPDFRALMEDDNFGLGRVRVFAAQPLQSPDSEPEGEPGEKSEERFGADTGPPQQRGAGSATSLVARVVLLAVIALGALGAFLYLALEATRTERASRDV